MMSLFSSFFLFFPFLPSSSGVLDESMHAWTFIYDHIIYMRMRKIIDCLMGNQPINQSTNQSYRERAL